MPDFNEKEVLIHYCKEKAFHAFAFEYIFDRRAQTYGRLITWLKLLGIALPSVLGLLILSYNFVPSALEAIKYTVSFISIFLFIISLFVAIFKLDDELPYSYESALSHSSFYERFKNLYQFPNNDLEEFKKLYDLLMVEVMARNHQDTKHNIKDWERRMGMRFSLREHEYECKGCKIIPRSMDSTDCDICGKFSFIYKYFK